MKKFYLFLFAIFLINNVSLAQSDKHYSLFHPVPKASLREMETDRPDVTESPITVDAGHFQFESDLGRLDRSVSNSSSINTYLLNQANLKLGITNSTAIQVVVQSFAFSNEKEFDSGNIERNHGFGDLIVRIKQNLLGNDKGKFAISILPFIKFPTSNAEEDEQYEGGIIVPMSLKLPGEFHLGMQIEADRLQDDEGTALHNQLLQSLTLSHQLAKHLDGIAETYYTYDLKASHWNNFLNAALQLEIAKDVKIDGGLNYGIQHDAMKSYFVGLSFRL
ncbi:transporter [Pedobacter mucosus]|uniref:transporter n=1 Tax=Pedobacter mucosus TaxID=2895286 RepID=UPI001EE4B09F|nr:transporter [Pedobacter mucosus]UKT65834.1 transporter [Pedobacter mucosus]